MPDLTSDRIEVTEETIVPLLIKAFFAHAPISQTSLGAGDENIRRLCAILDKIFAAIEHEKFDRDRCSLVTDGIIRDYFAGKGFGYFRKQMAEEHKLHYQNPTAIRARGTFAAICNVACDIFSNSNTAHDQIREIRRDLSVQSDSEVFESQRSVLRAIEGELRKIYSRPRGPISFEGKENKSCPVIKVTNRFFPSNEDIRFNKKFVLGRFNAFRRIFSPEANYEFIREPVAIEETIFGITFRLNTKIRVAQDRDAIVEGVLFFTEEAFWLLGSYAVPFHRVRVMAANMAEWQRYERGTQNFCTGVFMTHRKDGDEKVPQTRVTVFKRTPQNHENNEAEFLTRDTVTQYLSPGEIAVLDAESHAMLALPKNDKHV